MKSVVKYLVLLMALNFTLGAVNPVTVQAEPKEDIKQEEVLSEETIEDNKTEICIGGASIAVLLTFVLSDVCKRKSWKKML